jgi:hypothetical protein
MEEVAVDATIIGIGYGAWNVDFFFEEVVLQYILTSFSRII